MENLGVQPRGTFVDWPLPLGGGGPVMPARGGLAFLGTKGHWETLKSSLAALLTPEGVWGSAVQPAQSRLPWLHNHVQQKQPWQPRF